MKKSLIALAFGTFALGMAEFVMMSILPYVAQSMQCSIPEAVHLISAYAIGVCVGAPSVVLVARKRPLHQILLGLIVIYLTGNLLMASCSDLHLGVLFRFISGLPHGAYFGVGSIVADRLAPRGKSTSAIAIMCSGMTVANLIGIPAGTWLSDMVSWRVIFLFNGAWGILTFILLYRLVPRMEPLPNTGLKGQFRFLKSAAPWLIMATTTFGNGGIFCWYSYVSPLMLHTSGFRPDDLTLIIMLAGFGMFAGNIVGGHYADRFSHLLRGACPLPLAGADVSDDGLPLLRLVAPAAADPRKFARRRDARRGPRAGGFQPGQRPGSLRRRPADRPRTRL